MGSSEESHPLGSQPGERQTGGAEMRRVVLLKRGEREGRESLSLPLAHVLLRLAKQAPPCPKSSGTGSIIF